MTDHDYSTPQGRVEADHAFDLLGHLLAFEQGELDEDGTIALFQHLVNTGDAWRLQGFYGRTAHDLIVAGVVHLPEAPEDAPRWNCVSFPGDGMHYLGDGDTCRWCGRTKAEFDFQYGSGEVTP